jgi:hypothetical protein
MAYTSDESKKDQVYVQSYPVGRGKWQVSIAGGSQPRWRRDGKELFYLAPDRTLMAVPVNIANGFDYGAAQPLFKSQAAPQPQTFTFAAAADGERFLIQTQVRATDTADQPFTVVLNWLAGVRK